MMLSQNNAPPLQSPLLTVSVLVFHLLTHSCRGESQLIGPPRPIAALVGDDIILPCHLEPAVDVVSMTLEWTKSDANSIFVHVWRSQQDVKHTQDKSYKGRTSLFTDELKMGNISLKLSNVKPSDRGTYKCFIPVLKKASFVELVVGSVSSPEIQLAGLDESSSSVELQCESAGWYPEPEVLWLDGDGNLLSAGPIETVRGPDDLYTVSSRVTVEKKHSNKFTCRVQQNNINQSRETWIHVPDDFFMFTSSSNASIIAGLAAGLVVCVVFISAGLFFICKWRQKVIKAKRIYWDETDKGQSENCSKTEKTEAERQQEQLLTDATEPMETSKHSSWSPYKWFKDEVQRRQEAEVKVASLTKQLLEEKDETENLKMKLQTEEEEHSADVSRLKKEERNCKKKLQRVQKELNDMKKQLDVESDGEQSESRENLLQSLRQELEDNKRELEEYEEKMIEIRENTAEKLNDEFADQQSDSLESVQDFEEEKQKMEKLQELQHMLDTNKMELDELLADVQKLEEKKRRSDNNLQLLHEHLESLKKEFDDSSCEDWESNSEDSSDKDKCILS
ncbi:butyrophilin subfamily 3 member A3-like [Acanthochromis polyacanthus]|uniref:butyrophilin subfamily 3 member A3-like n=1 Tax=Acanthochromis polyacanthus TaxID=80966 RepID=UPI0022341AFF|nr:butyrophilin subfamily 3 member A3-like [Acanthochromis polyacanthus]